MMYTTPRIENADRVVEWFRENGIAARITNDAGWRGRSHRRFSYMDGRKHQGSWPQVWVIRAEDQPKARALLREIGIEPAVRFNVELEEARFGSTESPRARRGAVVTRVRRVLLAVIGILAIMVVLKALQ